MDFIITSTCSDRELVLSSRDGDYFEARLKGDVEAFVRVYAYTDELGLNKLLQDLGSRSSPWPGELSWESIEGEFGVAATCSSLGKVEFAISLWGHPGGPEEWQVQACLESEFGQLPAIAKRADRFFRENT